MTKNCFLFAYSQYFHSDIIGEIRRKRVSQTFVDMDLPYAKAILNELIEFEFPAQAHSFDTYIHISRKERLHVNPPLKKLSHKIQGSVWDNNSISIIAKPQTVTQIIATGARCRPSNQDSFVTTVPGSYSHISWDQDGFTIQKTNDYSYLS